MHGMNIKIFLRIFDPLPQDVTKTHQRNGNHPMPPPPQKKKTTTTDHTHKTNISDLLVNVLPLLRSVRN
jgi:hypothetical protein